MNRLRGTPGGVSLSASPDETLLSAARRAGYSVPAGCRNGNCGLCHVNLLAGRVRLLHSEQRAPSTIPLCIASALGKVTVEALPRVHERTCLSCQVTGFEKTRLTLRLPAGRVPLPAIGQRLRLGSPLAQWARVTGRAGRELSLALDRTTALPPCTRLVRVEQCAPLPGTLHCPP